MPSAPSTSASPPSPVSEQPQQGWEEPTTVQAPVWEEEPPKPSVSTPDGWTATQETNEQKREQEQLSLAESGEVVSITTPAPAPPQQEAPAPKEAEPQPAAPIQPAINVPVVAATPSPKLGGRSAAGSHRLSSRYKTTDQPVVMPNSFGASIEKVGMQFGSLSLGGDSLDSNP